MTGLVERLHHRLELAHLVAMRSARCVAGVGGEEADGVVAPVVGEAPLDERPLGHELVDGQELHGRHPEPPEVVHDRGRGQPGVRPAQVPGTSGWRMVKPLTWLS